MADQQPHETLQDTAEADTQGHMIAQDRVRPGPAGTDGGGNPRSLVPEDYEEAWNMIKRFRPSDVVPL